jgi:DNA-binding transcriptional LysR family regulator
MGQLEDMNAFIRVVEAGGISRAAEQMDIAKSAISRRLADLETRLGVRLINRTTRTSSLTEAGQSYYERAVRVIDDVAELNTITADSNCTLEGTIRLAAPLSFGLAHLTPAIDAFTKEHPELNFNVDFSDRQIDLVEEGIDVAVRIADLKDSTLVARKISPIRLMLCASPDYIKENGLPETPGELKKHRLLQYSISASSTLRFKDKKVRNTW